MWAGHLVWMEVGDDGQVTWCGWKRVMWAGHLVWMEARDVGRSLGVDGSA